MRISDLSGLEQISIASELRDVCRLGVIQIEGVRIRESSDELKALINELADGVASRYGGSALGEIPEVQAVRKIFHRTGLDPTRHRPSSESLLRRVVKGKGLFFINSAVDLVNYFSLKTLLPMGLYDAERITPPIEFRAGREGETYEGIGRETLHLAHFPLLADSEGPFGSAVSDSVRTQVSEGCTRLLWVTFAPAGTEIALSDFARGMTRFNGGIAAAVACL